MNEVEIPIKITGIGSLKTDLRNLKEEIANATDPADMQRLVEKAGDVADRIKDANEQVSVFTTGSNFEKVSNSFSLMSNDLMSLDFEGANEKATVFAGALGKIGKADVSGAIKGIIGMMGKLGAAFVKLGVQILMNPIFLLVAVIIAIVAAVALVMQKFGVLQKVLDALMLPLNMLIAGFNLLTDWMELTDNAGEERAKNEMARMDAEAAAGEKRMQRLTDANKGEMSDYDRKIALAAAEGKSTVELQRAKIKASIAYQTQVIAESKLKLKQIYLNLQELQTLNIEDEEKKKRQAAGNKAMADARALITTMGEARRDSFNQLKVMDAQEIEAQKKKIAEGRKGTGANKNNLKEQLDDIKAFNAEKLKLQDMEAKNTINLMEEGYDKEYAIRQQAFMDFKNGFLAETIKEELAALDKQFLAKKISEEQYNTQLLALKENAHRNLTEQEKVLLQQAMDLKARDVIKLQINAENLRLAGEQMIQDAKFAAMAEGTEKELLAQENGYKRLRQAAKNDVTLTAEQKKALIAIYDEQEKAQIATQLAEKVKAQEDLLLTLQDEATQKREAENAQFLLDVEAANGNAETLELLAKKHADNLANIDIEASNAKVATAQKERDAKLGFAKDTVDGLTNLGGMLIKDQKKLEQFNKASALVQIGIDTAKAISALVAASNTNPLNGVTAGAAGIAQFASGIIQIATNVAKAKQILSSPGATPSTGGGGGDDGGGSTSTATALPQAAQLFGSSNTGGSFSAGGDSSSSMTVTAIVSETQVTSTQQKINRINKSSEL